MTQFLYELLVDYRPVKISATTAAVYYQSNYIYKVAR